MINVELFIKGKAFNPESIADWDHVSQILTSFLGGRMSEKEANHALKAFASRKRRLVRQRQYNRALRARRKVERDKISTS